MARQVFCNLVSGGELFGKSWPSKMKELFRGGEVLSLQGSGEAGCPGNSSITPGWVGMDRPPVGPPPPQGTRGESLPETWVLTLVHLSPPPHHENGKMSGLNRPWLGHATCPSPQNLPGIREHHRDQGHRLCWMWAPSPVDASHSWVFSPPWNGMKLREGGNLAGGHTAVTGGAPNSSPGCGGSLRTISPLLPRLRAGGRGLGLAPACASPRGRQMALRAQAGLGSDVPAALPTPQPSPPRRRLGRGPWATWGC